MTASRRKPREPRPSAERFKTLADYRAAGALTPPPPQAYWLVVAPDGSQFSIHPDRTDAVTWAATIKGTVRPHKPIESTYWNPGETHYDH